mmetsp:Transcript_25412/g.81904  ORF Transcript_25412/g.81904 Transcript_25412/m.81904 type:complete len:279 (+) Transcript_25412:1265-2101(+)
MRPPGGQLLAAQVLKHPHRPTVSGHQRGTPRQTQQRVQGQEGNADPTRTRPKHTRAARISHSGAEVASNSERDGASEDDQRIHGEQESLFLVRTWPHDCKPNDEREQGECRAELGRRPLEHSRTSHHQCHWSCGSGDREHVEVEQQVRRVESPRLRPIQLRPLPLPGQHVVEHDVEHRQDHSVVVVHVDNQGWKQEESDAEERSFHHWPQTSSEQGIQADRNEHDPDERPAQNHAGRAGKEREHIVVVHPRRQGEHDRAHGKRARQEGRSSMEHSHRQ